MSDLPVKEICFPQDTAERKQWFKSASFSHPAKMHLSLQFYLIEHYTKPGDTILDPMTGSGTVLVACALGRNVVAVELEQKFVDMQKANWEKIKSLGSMLGYRMGEAVILQGDARNLMDFSFGFLHRHKADCAIFSPPYEATIVGKDKDKYKQMERKSGKDKWGKYLRLGQSQFHKYTENDKDNTNIGNLKSNNYLEAMLLVYQNCFRVLKPKGLLILVTKNFIRDKKIVRLDLDTIKLCEQAGFTLIERLKRKLTQMSFWRRTYQQKYPDAPTIDFEDVLVFQKGAV